MTSVYILSTRLLKNPTAKRLSKNLVNDLHKLSFQQPGFIYAKTFWNNNKNHIYTVTKWESEDDWVNWYKSKERNNVVKQYCSEAIKENHETIENYDHPEIITKSWDEYKLDNDEMKNE